MDRQLQQFFIISAFNMLDLTAKDEGGPLVYFTPLDRWRVNGRLHKILKFARLNL